MSDRAAGPNLYIPSPIAVLRYRAHTRTINLPNGERAKVTIDDSGTVQTEPPVEVPR